jgi:hypothetical protein
VIADLDFAQIDSRKRLVDACGHYCRPELLSLLIDRTPASHVHERTAHPNAEALRAAVDEERTAEVLNQQPPSDRVAAQARQHRSESTRHSSMNTTG